MNVDHTFVFSSRRWHTKWPRDWSSDVCSSDLLLTAELQTAEEAISISDELDEVRIRSEERAVDLLALENPVAKDLRQVVSSIYIVEDLQSMGGIAKIIAKAAHRRLPTPDSLEA